MGALRSASRVGVGFLIVTAGLVAMIVPSTASPVAAVAPSWSITPSPSPPGPAGGELRSVTCTSTTNCFAVGQTGWYTLIERWNGTSWVVVPSPDPTSPTGGINNDLTGVACATTTTCFAVGSKEGGASVLIERWSGTAWSLASFWGSGVLSGISCSGATSCHAVGTRGLSTFAMRWNGASWGTVPSPNPTGATASRLSSVKCTAANSCMAVGSYDIASTTKTLIERWNGTAWSIVTSPNPTGATSSRLNSVACPVTASCFAVGQSVTGTTTRTLIERWNGTSWTIVASPNPTAGAPALSSVGCAGVSSCFAVGSKGAYTLVERWNGTTWSIVTSPNPVGAASNRLNGVNCTSSTECFAVGMSDYRTMAQRWNGTAWSIQPDPAGGSQSGLLGVACTSSTSCFAVGSYLPPGSLSTRTLAERWNGTAWTIVASPNPIASSNSRLRDVDCPSAALCIAVGATTIGGQERTLVEAWNGTSWTILASPNVVSTTSNVLLDVDCPSATSCFAVGATIADRQQHTLVERWDGTAWTIAAGAVVGRLGGVSCVGASDCVAVGSGLGVTDPAALVLRWDGTAWSPVSGPVPVPDAFGTEATAVSCTATNDCTVVGTTLDPFRFTPNPFAARWDGTTWSVASFPSAWEPRDVSCATSTDCTAVGTYFKYPINYNTRVEHWDGTSWSIVTSPNFAIARESYLEALACTSATSCIAVGSWVSDAHHRTLAERYA